MVNNDLDRKAKRVSGGFRFLEGPRWHDGALWFSDMGARQIYRMTEDGEATLVATVPTIPSGLGWMPDGSMLVVSMEDSALCRVANGEARPWVDLSAHAIWANDLSVDREGRAYVTQAGHNVVAGHDHKAARMIVVDPDGSVRTYAEGLEGPNGIWMAPDQRTLVVAEAAAARLIAFDVVDGELRNQRTLLQLDRGKGEFTDGICMDSEGATWVAVPWRGEILRVTADGRVVDSVRPVGEGLPFACALGGEDMRTLYMMVSVMPTNTSAPDLENSSSHVESVRVPIPGFE